MVDVITIRNFDPDPEEEIEEGVDLVLLGIYVSVGLITLILILCIIMIVEKVRKKYKRIT